MESIVLDLQRLATSEESSVTNLLRKARIVARKLNLDEFSEWTRNELQGYDSNDVPLYRVVSGQPQATTMAGTQPLVFEEDEMNELFSKRPIRDPIGKIEHLASADSTYLFHQVPASITRRLSRHYGADMIPRIVISKSAFSGIVEAVRNSVLEWALDLEAEGIMGEGLTFSSDEKAKAAQTNYTVHIGTMNNSQLQQGTRESSQTLTVSDDTLGEIQEFIRALKELLSEANLNGSDRSEVDAEIATVEAQLQSPKPKPGILRESLSSIRSIIEGFGGSLLASGVADQLPVLIAQLDIISP